MEMLYVKQIRIFDRRLEETVPIIENSFEEMVLKTVYDFEEMEQYCFEGSNPLFWENSAVKSICAKSVSLCKVIYKNIAKRIHWIMRDICKVT